MAMIIAISSHLSKINNTIGNKEKNKVKLNQYKQNEMDQFQVAVLMNLCMCNKDNKNSGGSNFYRQSSLPLLCSSPSSLGKL